MCRCKVSFACACIAVSSHISVSQHHTVIQFTNFEQCPAHSPPTLQPTNPPHSPSTPNNLQPLSTPHIYAGSSHLSPSSPNACAGFITPYKSSVRYDYPITWTVLDRGMDRQINLLYLSVPKMHGADSG